MKDSVHPSSSAARVWHFHQDTATLQMSDTDKGQEQLYRQEGASLPQSLLFQLAAASEPIFPLWASVYTQSQHPAPRVQNPAPASSTSTQLISKPSSRDPAPALVSEPSIQDPGLSSNTHHQYLVSSTQH